MIVEALLVLFAAVLALGYHVWAGMVADIGEAHLVGFVSKYEREFPGRCGACAYHRIAMQHGHAGPDDCVEHFCRERGRWVE